MKKLLLISFFLCSLSNGYCFKSKAPYEVINKANIKLASIGCKWEFVKVVDSFGNPTDEVYLIYEFEGEFSNTVVRNQKCCGILRFYDDDEGEIKYYHYCDEGTQPYGNDFKARPNLIGETSPIKGELEFMGKRGGYKVVNMINILKDTQCEMIKIRLGKVSENVYFVVDKTGIKEVLRIMEYLKTL